MRNVRGLWATLVCHEYDASVLTAEAENAAYFEQVADGRDGKMAANWVINELFGRLEKGRRQGNHRQPRVPCPTGRH